jgi:ribosomal protein S18 acetylase RimI-like enzyme
MSDLDAVLSWLHRFDELRAGRVVPLRAGLAVLSEEFPAAHDLNKLSITDAGTGHDLVATAETILGGAGLRHRLIAFRTPAVDDSVSVDLLAAGYQCESELMMIHSEAASARAPQGVEVLSVEERVAVAKSSWRRALPQESAEVWRQLGERVRTVNKAGTATFFGMRDVGGAIIASADLYERDGIAQIENVLTSEEHRGQGHATAMLLAALTLARANGSSMIFLVADAEDWPKVLYRRLGFRDAGVVTSWHRASRTPT